MAYQKMFVFDPRDLTQLLTHYTDGMVPLDHEVGNVGFNPYLQRFVGIEVISDEWDTSEPLHLRYDGKRTMSWAKNQGMDTPVWEELNETPNRQ